MATISQPLPTRGRLRPKLLVFAFIGLMMAYVLYHNERFLINPGDPVWAHYQPFQWWLLTGIGGSERRAARSHAVLGSPAPALPRWHRVVGWIYVAAAMILAPLGAYIQYFQERMGETRSFSVADAFDAALLMLTTAIALWFVLRGKIQQHRQWMTRSYAVALVFLEVRVIGGLTGWDNNVKAIETVVWTCLIFAVPLADIVLQWEDFRRSKLAATKARAAAA